MFIVMFLFPNSRAVGEIERPIPSTWLFEDAAALRAHANCEEKWPWFQLAVLAETGADSARISGENGRDWVLMRARARSKNDY